MAGDDIAGHRLRLSAEYECEPLWVERADGVLNVRPEELPLSDDLVASISAWARRWDATYRPDDPASSGFPSDSEQRRHAEEGQALATRLQEELPSYDVTYLT